MNSWLLWGSWVLVLLVHAGYVCSLVQFCSFQAETPRRKKFLAAGLILAGIIIVNHYYERWSTPYILYSLIRNFLLYSLILLLFQARWEKKLLMVSMLVIIEKLVGNFSVSFLCCLILLILKGTGMNHSILFEDWFNNLIGAMSFVIISILICVLMKPAHHMFQHKSGKWFLTLTVPLLFMILIIDVVNWGASNGLVVVSGVIGAEYGRIESNALFSHLAICLLTLLMICMAAGYVFGMDKLYTEQQRKEQYRSQVDFYRMLEEQYRQLERLRHDMKNHLISMQGLWMDQDWGKLGSYLEQMMEAGNVAETEEATGSKAMDALLYRKRKLAEEGHITWECEMQRLDQCGNIQEFDLCVLVGNILDNALEACERLPAEEDRYISVRCCKWKQYLLLEVRNSTDVKTVASVGHTRKEHPEEHGIGMMNIRETAQKYSGVVNIETAHGEFVISVLLPFGKTVYDGKPTV